MWGTAVGVGFLAALHPMRIAMILLMLSKPRPIRNLLAYSAGGLILAIPFLLLPLLVVHSTTTAKRASGPSSTASHVQIGVGVFLLSIAALMTVRALMRARQQAHLPMPAGNGSTQVLDRDAASAISRLPGRAQDAPTQVGSAIRRLLDRARYRWKSLWEWANGSLWFAMVFGLIMAPADGIIFVFTLMMGSRAPIGTQVGAAVMFVAGWLAFTEVVLATYLARPAKTQAALQLLQNWMAIHYRQVTVAIFVVAGLTSIAKGMRVF
jgi:hypothetical protein